MRTTTTLKTCSLLKSRWRQHSSSCGIYSLDSSKDLTLSMSLPALCNLPHRGALCAARVQDPVLRGDLVAMTLGAMLHLFVWNS